MKFELLEDKMSFRLTLISTIVVLLLLGLNQKWILSLSGALETKREELGESLALVASGDQAKGSEGDIEIFEKIKKGQTDAENWSDSIAPLVAEQKLILRQVRPLSTEQRGKIREEKIFVQVDGSVDGILGLMHSLASQESAVYVSRYLVTTRSIGTGFISAEIVVSRMIL